MERFLNFRVFFRSFKSQRSIKMLQNQNQRIDILVFVDPCSIDLASALEAVKKVQEYNFRLDGNRIIQTKITLTNQNDLATTAWPNLLEFVDRVRELGQKKILIFSSLIGLTSDLAKSLKGKVDLFGEWKAMADGIQVAYDCEVLKGMEHVIDKSSYEYVLTFAERCKSLGISYHPELLEIQFVNGQEDEIRDDYLKRLPTISEISQLTRELQQSNLVSQGKIMAPFWEKSGCNYISEGLFLRPNTDKLAATVCLSNITVVVDDFLGEENPIEKYLNHPTVRSYRKVKNPTCPAMCQLLTGNCSAKDPRWP